jgi:HK97 family phage major capsid protein
MPELAELVEKRNHCKALQDAMFAVDDQAGEGEKRDYTQVKTINGEDVSKISTLAKCEKVRKINDELVDLMKDLDTMVAAENALKAAKAQRSNGGSQKAYDGIEHPTASGGYKSFGEQIIESKWYQEFKAAGGASNPMAPGSILKYGVRDLQMKTLFQTSAGLAPESTRTGLLVDAVTRPIQVMDLFPTTPTGQDTFKYLLETTRTHSAAEKAEATAFAESTFVLTEQSQGVEKITDSVPTTDEQLADAPIVSGYLSGRIEFGLRQRLDNQLINGDGSTPNLKGVLNHAISEQALSTDDKFTNAKKAITLVRVTGRAFPSAFVYHPNDWQEIVLQQTTDGIFIMGNPALTPADRLWGLRVVEADVIAEGTGLVGDFMNFSLLVEREGIDIRTGFVNDDFTKGRVTLRGTLRVAVVVTRPTAFCKMTGI